MHDIFEYLEWRGDISFQKIEPVDTDYAIFASLAYIPYDGTVAKDGFIPFKEAAAKVLKKVEGTKKRTKLRMEEDGLLLKSAASSVRFGELMTGYYASIINPDKEEQFSAVSFLLPQGDIVAVFRGTDGTIVGWKEDFNMGFLNELPSQKDAVAYLNNVASYNGGRLYVCGHSKGGNLAMYASAFAKRDVQDRIAAIRSLDGPGFKKTVTDSKGFARVLDRMKTFMPQSSIVGLLLEHKEKHMVIHSFAKAAKQHNMYTWSISGASFTEEEGLSESSINTNKAINAWITDMSEEKRMRLTEGIFEIAQAADVDTLEELFEARNLPVIMKKIGKLDDETKELIVETGRIFMNSYKKRKQEGKNN